MSRNLFVASGIFHPESGGPATYLYEVLPSLQDMGWNVRLQSYSNDPHTDVMYPYPVQRIPRRTFPIRAMHYALASRQAAGWADLIYLHTIDLPLLIARNVPRVIKIVGDQAWERCIRKGWVPPTTDIDEFQAGECGVIADRQQALRSRQVQGMDAVIVPSEYLKRMVMGWGVPQERIHVIYNALPEVQTSELPSKTDARRQFELPDAPMLLTAARLTPWKGVDHIIEALQQVPDVHLVIAGDGSEMPRLRELAEPIADRIHFLGWVPRDNMEVLRQAADYFVLYSGYEGLPHTVLESLRQGLPVIVSDKGGNPEVIRENVNGLLVPYVDVDALAQTIHQAFAGDTQGRLAENAKIDTDQFVFSTLVQHTHAVLEQYCR